MSKEKDWLKFECLQEFDCECQYCHREGTLHKDPDGKAWHLDRIWPGHTGGKYEADNVTLACRLCNLQKGGHEPLDDIKWDGVISLQEAQVIGHRGRHYEAWLDLVPGRREKWEARGWL